MDTLGPRIMVNVGTQAVTNPGINPRDLAPLTNDAFLATFMGKPALPTTNGITRQNNHNNYRQSYTTQMERGALRSKGRPATTNGESIEPDSAILSIIRSNGLDNNQHPPSQRQYQGNRNYRRPFHQQKFASTWNDIPCSPNYRPTNEFNRQRRTRSGGAQQQITVVDQMAAQPHIPYAILPKRFEPKQVPTNGFQQHSRSSNNYNYNRQYRQGAPVPRRPYRQQNYYEDQWEDVEDEDTWPQSANRRRLNQRPNRNFGQTTTYRGPRQRFNNYYNSYSYGTKTRQGQFSTYSHRRTMYRNDGYVPFNIVPSYDLNEWQGPYAQSRKSLYSQYKRSGFRRGRNENGFIHDDHRANNPSRQSRNSNKPTTSTHRRKTTKLPKTKGQQKRRTSRKSKQRNQNSKSEGTTSATTNEVKPTTENETTEENKQKEETKPVAESETTEENKPTTETEDKPLPPRDNENKQTEVEKPTE